MNENQKKYVTFPWVKYIPAYGFLAIMMLPVFLDTGITVFHLPIETFICVICPFIYLVVYAFIYIFINNRKED